jgi:hypothetical protein
VPGTPADVEAPVTVLSRRHWAATHEAAHLTVAFMLGVKIAYAWVFDDGRGLAQTAHTAAGYPADSLLDHATVALAGNWADMSYWSEKDWKNTLELGELVRKRVGEDEAWRRHWVLGAGERAAALLRDPRGRRASISVAAALYERGTLDGADAVLIMEGA